MVASPLLPTGAKLLNSPPVTVMSWMAKSLLASLRVKVMVSVLPVAKVPVPTRVTMTVGGVVSAGGTAPWVLKSMATWLLASCTVPATPGR